MTAYKLYIEGVKKGKTKITRNNNTFSFSGVWNDRDRAMYFMKTIPKKYRIIEVDWLVQVDEDELEWFNIVLDKVPTPKHFERKFGYSFQTFRDLYKDGKLFLIMWDDGSVEVASYNDKCVTEEMLNDVISGINTLT